MIAYCIHQKASLENRMLLTYKNSQSLKTIKEDAIKVGKKNGLYWAVIEIYKNDVNEEPIKVFDLHKGVESK